MPSFAAIVEGFGEVAALPPLVGRVGSAFGVASYVSQPPIRVKGLPQLLKPGELERWILLAQTRNGTDATLIVLDVDEKCPLNLRNQFEARIDSMGNKVIKPVFLCFIKSEFESWFLADVSTLSQSLPDYGWSTSDDVQNYQEIRGAKERLAKIIGNVNYKETRDQEVMARNINVVRLYSKDRSFRRFVKCVTMSNYNDLDFLADVAA